MEWVMKLTKSYGQYRVTIPRDLIEEVGFEKVLLVRLRRGMRGMIIVEEYDGKGKEKRDLPEDKA